MYYCEECCTKSNMPRVFFKTWTACDICGNWREVYDNQKSPKLDPNAPCLREHREKLKNGIPLTTKVQHKRHGTFKKIFKPAPAPLEPVGA